MLAILADVAPLGGAEEAPRQSMLVWVLRSVGFGGLLLLLVGFLVFIGACLAVLRGKRPEVIASYAALVPIPLMLGLGLSLKAMVALLVRMATGPLKASEIADAVAEALMDPLIGLMTMAPSYLILAVGWVLRIARSESPADRPVADDIVHSAQR